MKGRSYGSSPFKIVLFVMKSTSNITIMLIITL